jgi:hypothetical protein
LLGFTAASTIAGIPARFASGNVGGKPELAEPVNGLFLVSMGFLSYKAVN